MCTCVYQKKSNLEMLLVNCIKPNQSDKQSNVCLCQASSYQISTLGQNGLHLFFHSVRELITYIQLYTYKNGYKREGPDPPPHFFRTH